MNTQLKQIFSLLFFILFLSLKNDSFAAASFSSDCPSPIEIQSQLEKHIQQIQPLIQSIPANLKISYQNLNLPIAGFIQVMNENEAQIKITGNKCHGPLSPDALSVLLCHEMGHMAGGPPFMKFSGVNTNIRISAEGQADYFATSSCLPLLWRNENNLPYLELLPTEPGLEKICPPTLPIDERSLCARISISSKAFQEYNYQSAKKEDKNSIPPRSPGPRPDLNKSDLNIAPKTLIREYPKLQCRLDTMLAGLRCQATQSPANFTTHPSTPLACGESAENASRPACWFRKESLLLLNR